MAQRTANVIGSKAGFAGAAALSLGATYLSGNRDLSSYLKTAATTTAWFLAPELMMTKDAVSLATAFGGLAINKVNDTRAKNARLYKRNFGGSYIDTDQAYTMRQSAVKAAQQTGIHMQQIFGNEASLMHR